MCVGNPSCRSVARAKSPLPPGRGLEATDGIRVVRGACGNPPDPDLTVPFVPQQPSRRGRSVLILADVSTFGEFLSILLWLGSVEGRTMEFKNVK